MTDEDYQALQPTIPDSPGVYQFLRADGVIVYVGKAKSLKKRLASYFGARQDRREKTAAMIRNAVTFRFTIVASEQDALLLESSLIRQHQPKYNIQLKTGDGYPFICITAERFPRVLFARKAIKKQGEYFGPYASRQKVYALLDLVRELFSLRTCELNLAEEAIKRGKYKVCLEYHIKKCKGACVGFETEMEYAVTVAQVRNMLRGQFAGVTRFLKEEMQTAAAATRFEQAQEYKERLALFEDYQGKSTVVNPSVKDVDVFAIETDDTLAFVNFMRVVNGAIIHTYTIELTKNLTDDPQELLGYAILELRGKSSSTATEIIVPFIVEALPDTLLQVVPKIGDKRKLLELATKNALYQKEQKEKQEAAKLNQQSSAERVMLTLKADLRIDTMPTHVECFDNSNFQGSFPVSSCVVFRNARPSKREYRHFNVKTVEGIDDFRSMAEVVLRRYSRMIDEGTPLPQLIVIDGGKGQLSAAVESLKTLGIYGTVRIVGIAKKLEEIYFPEDSNPLHINRKSESLKMIQQIRDEAHRFGISFHRDQRSRGMLKTELTQIEGIGEKTAEKLLLEFGSVQGVREAGFEAWVKHANLKVAGRLKAHFAGEGETNTSDTQLV